VRATEGRRDIHIVDRFVSEPERAALMQRCDAYVSLHRAEGFGLTLGEAMALGKPVIGTGFSSNLDFMTPANSYLVDHEMTQVGPEGENYPAEGTWAEPDLDHAAALMREVWQNQDEARARGERARRDIAEGFSVEAVGELARARLKLLGRIGRHSRARGAAAPAPMPSGNGLPNLNWIERAEAKLTFSPLRDAAERGGPVGMARRTVLQAMRPYTYHQDELNDLLVHAIRELWQRVDEAIVDSQADVRRVLLRIEALQRSGQLGGPDLERLLEGSRARPGSIHPAISYMDDSGHRALGFRDAARGDREGEGYRGFEDIFRGSEDQVRAGQEAYLDQFAGADWVLDIGCGRGEFLDALRERGIQGRGVDLDPTMVERCVEKGHDVRLADATEYLEGVDDATVPGVFAAQVIEHLSSEQLNDFLALLHRKLAPGGVLVMETVNPHNPAALKAFWTDTTHHHPLFPEVTLALCRLHGFDSGDVVFPDASGNFDEDVYTNRDYAVVARKAPAGD
jgi:SAM-dependent methyltransferase